MAFTTLGDCTYPFAPIVWSSILSVSIAYGLGTFYDMFIIGIPPGAIPYALA